MVRLYRQEAKSAMNFSVKFPGWIAAALLALVVVACILEFQPVRRVDAAFHGFLQKVEKRKWAAVEKRIAADYRDRWGFHRASLLESLPQGFRHFYVLEIKAESPQIDIQGKVATVKCRIRMDGRGTAIADEILNRVQGLKEPFVFTYRKQSWKPWDWKLESVDQPELAVEGYSQWLQNGSRSIGWTKRGFGPGFSGDPVRQGGCCLKSKSNLACLRAFTSSSCLSPLLNDQT